MLYDFDYAVKRWKQEYPELLKYLEQYKDMKYGTIVRYDGWLDNLNFLADFLKIIGKELPEIDWINGDTRCHFHAKGDLSEYEITIYDSEKMFDDDPDYMIAKYTGSLTPKQMNYIIGILPMYGSLKAELFLGFGEAVNCDTFDEVSPEYFVCIDTVKF